MLMEIYVYLLTLCIYLQCIGLQESSKLVLLNDGYQYQEQWECADFNQPLSRGLCLSPRHVQC